MTAILISMAMWLAAAQSGPVWEQVPERLSLLRNPSYLILAVEVLEVENPDATNASPPRGRMQVTEVLRGRGLEPGAYLFEVIPPTTAETDKDPDWPGQSYPPPQVGDRLIVFVYLWQEKLEKENKLYWQGPVVRLTDANRAEILDRMAPPERVWWIQLPLALLILVLPLFSAGLFAAGRWGRMSDRTRRHCRRWSLLLPAFSFPLYAYYEMGISSYSDIRVDLLFLWPALLLNLVLLLSFGATYLWKRPSNRAAG